MPNTHILALSSSMRMDDLELNHPRDLVLSLRLAAGETEIWIVDVTGQSQLELRSV
jgi:hypothetical protein